MSVSFERTHNTNAGDVLAADHATKLAPSLPFSVSLWVRFPGALEDGDTHTVFFYGDKDSIDVYLVLEAERSGADIAALRASLRDGDDEPIAAGPTADVTIGDWNLVTVVVSEPAEGQTKVEIFLNDEPTTWSATGALEPTLSAYDRFALGRLRGCGLLDRAQRGRRAA